MAIARWIGARLNRKILAAMGLSLAGASLVFLLVFVTVYRGELLQQRAEAADQINRFLQIALENAMLKRDIDGLQHIVKRLGNGEQIAGAAILAPDGEVRFASEPVRLGSTMPTTPGERFVTDELGRDVLRSVRPVPNRAECEQCHGSIDESPVNGTLVIDYRADAIRASSIRSALAMTGAGLAVALATGLGVWSGLRHWVLQPASALSDASARLARGDLMARSEITSADEFGTLSRAFDDMAARLQSSLERHEFNEAFQQALIDAIPDAVRVIGSDFRTLAVNRAFLKLHGGTVSEARRLPCHMMSHDRSEPCPSEMEICPVQRLRDGKLNGPLSFRARHRRSDGTPCLVELRAAPITIPTDGGTIRGVVESIRDLDADLAASHEQKLAELSMLATGVAHEIRNPLSSMSFALHDAMLEIDRGSLGPAQRHVQVALEETERCFDFTNNLLKLSRPASETLELVGIGAALRETLALLTPEAEASGIVVACDIEDDLRAEISDGEFRRVIINIVQNGFHAMPNGGELAISARRIVNELAVSFRDTGRGIALEDLDRIFQPFWSRRADGVVGTGLGLALCKSAVESWGGRIDVESAPGAGSCFTVLLPCADSLERIG